mmetsp:Transcript_53965/g.136322  ORF Transcript_53965/g.136322 Transcript_53965/m.136322 type:complete len:269 (+) Transcript_53965:899-1705(+)
MLRSLGRLIAMRRRRSKGWSRAWSRRASCSKLVTLVRQAPQQRRELQQCLRRFALAWTPSMCHWTSVRPPQPRMRYPRAAAQRPCLLRLTAASARRPLCRRRRSLEHAPTAEALVTGAVTCAGAKVEAAATSAPPESPSSIPSPYQLPSQRKCTTTEGMTPSVQTQRRAATRAASRVQRPVVLGPISVSAALCVERRSLPRWRKLRGGVGNHERRVGEPFARLGSESSKVAVVGAEKASLVAAGGVGVRRQIVILSGFDQLATSQAYL